jgi:hypothetical protein
MSDYRVYRGDELLGTLTRTDGDMPWHEGTFHPTAAFAGVAALFDRERELLDADCIDECNAIWEEIVAPGIWLEPLDGREMITECLLHIEGRRAWWQTDAAAARA